MRDTDQKPRYGNWVSTDLLKRMAVLLVVISLVDASLWMFTSGWHAVKAIFTLVALLCLIATAYFLLARWLFAAQGGDIQSRVLDELTNRIQWNGTGEVLDIGCGSGALSIRIAKKYPASHVTGIDYWGSGWSYCKEQCEENARLEGAEKRLSFRQASASARKIGSFLILFRKRIYGLGLSRIRADRKIGSFLCGFFQLYSQAAHN